MSDPKNAGRKNHSQGKIENKTNAESKGNTDTFYQFEEICKDYKKLLDDFDINTFPFGDHQNYNMNRRNKLIRNLSDDPSTYFQYSFLQDFATQIILTFDKNKAWEGIACWPPHIDNVTPEAKDAIFILVDLIFNLHNKEKRRLNALTYISTYCVPERFRTNKEFSSSVLKACCVCRRKRKVLSESHDFWATLDIHNEFKLWIVENGNLIQKTNKQINKIGIEDNGKTLCLLNNGEVVKRITPIDPKMVEKWIKAFKNPPYFRPKFPLFLTVYAKPPPYNVLIALLETLMNDAYCCVTALTNFKVVSVSKSSDLMEALFDIFAYEGKVHELMMLLSVHEFSVPELQVNTVLRGNSHLTNLFKVFFKRFGKKYFDDFLKNVVLYMDSYGDLRIKEPEAVDKEKAKKLVFSVLLSVANSIKYVPSEIKHFASVLKTCASRRFNCKQATYNTLSGFFYLRFVSAILSNPLDIDKNLPLKNPWVKVLVPESQLLMQPFNMVLMDGRYEIFSDWNDELVKDVFPKLNDFVYAVADGKEVYYQPPSKERLEESLNIVLSYISEAGEKFTNKYDELTSEVYHQSPLGNNLAYFITSFFNHDSKYKFTQ